MPEPDVQVRQGDRLRPAPEHPPVQQVLHRLQEVLQGRGARQHAGAGVLGGQHRRVLILRRVQGRAGEHDRKGARSVRTSLLPTRRTLLPAATRAVLYHPHSSPPLLSQQLPCLSQLRPSSLNTQHNAHLHSRSQPSNFKIVITPTPPPRSAWPTSAWTSRSGTRASPT